VENNQTDINVLIKRRYEEKGEKVVIRSHPESDNFFGKNAKKALLGKGKINKFRASIYYMFDVLNSIRKYYKKKNCDTLIIVRYLIGTAYLPLKLAKFGYSFFSQFVPTSQYMFFLDTSPDNLFERIKVRKEKEIFETLNELENVRKKSLLLIKNWNIVDTSGSIQDTYKKIEKVLDNLDQKG